MSHQRPCRLVGKPSLIRFVYFDDRAERLRRALGSSKMIKFGPWTKRL